MLLNSNGQQGMGELFFLGVLKSNSGSKIGQEFCLKQDWPIVIKSSYVASGNVAQSVIIDPVFYETGYRVNLKKIGASQLDRIAHLALTPIIRRQDELRLDVTMDPIAKDLCAVIINPKYSRSMELK